MSRHFSRPSRAFTLVEILIVVIILGILAAIVTPQFSSATEQAQTTSAIDQLKKIRSAISVYYVRNGNTLPDITAGDATWGPLIGTGDYMRDAPPNPYVGSPNGTVITIGTGPDTSYQRNYGWIYDPSTGDLWAGGFDSQDNPLPKP
jgi:prepilin-type N-terminal cleavage/methylation domain-containing protein